MSEFQTITVRLSAEERDRLESEASRLRLTPDVLATKLLVERLAEVPDSLAALDALSQLRNLARQMPVIDAVKLARESREDLEHRGEF
jgi:predicted DNA-binding protein